MGEKLKRWAEWMDRRGFYVVLSVCIAVIVGSGLWARAPSPAQDPGQAVVQAPDFLESLGDVTPRPSPSPSPAPPLLRPVSGEMYRGFSPDLPIYQPTLDAWAVHLGIDLYAAQGEPVLAVADGQVTLVEKRALQGLLLEITHDQGHISRYAGLLEAAVPQGAAVRAGQTIGTAGGRHPAEALDGPHLHFEWWTDGAPADPAEALE